MLDMSKVRRVEGHWREIFPCSIVGTVLIGIDITDLMVSSSRRGARGAAGRNVYDESFFDGLTTWVIGIEGFGDRFFWAKDALGG